MHPNLAGFVGWIPTQRIWFIMKSVMISRIDNLLANNTYEGAIIKVMDQIGYWPGFAERWGKGTEIVTGVFFHPASLYSHSIEFPGVDVSSSGAPKVPSLWLILVHLVSQISSGLKSELLTILRRLQKHFLNFTVPGSSTSLPAAASFGLDMDRRGLHSSRCPYGQQHRIYLLDHFLGQCHSRTTKISHRN